MCDYCINDKEIKNDGDIKTCTVTIDCEDILIDFIDKNNKPFVQWIRINFCPMCGEKL